jgi:cyclase
MWIFRTAGRTQELEVKRARPSALYPTPDARQRIPALAAYCLLLIASCLVSTDDRLRAAGIRYAVVEVKPHVFVWVPEDIIEQDGDLRFSRAGNAGFILTTDGVAVVNTTNSPFHAREVLYEIRRRTDQSVKYVIDTGSDADQMLGNEVFVDQQATILSTPATQAEIRSYRQDLIRDERGDLKLQARMRGIHPTVPNQTFDHETTMRVGDQEIRLLALPGVGSRGDAAVLLPKAKVLFLGDLYENGYFPQIGSRDVRGWIETLRQVEGWDVEIYVPGHGDPSGKKELVEFRHFLEWLMAEVRTRIQEDKTVEQVKSELLPFAYHWRAPELGPRAVEAVYRQLAPQKPAAQNSEPGVVH